MDACGSFRLLHNVALMACYLCDKETNRGVAFAVLAFWFWLVGYSVCAVLRNSLRRLLGSRAKCKPLSFTLSRRHPAKLEIAPSGQQLIGRALGPERSTVLGTDARGQIADAAADSHGAIL